MDVDHILHVDKFTFFETDPTKDLKAQRRLEPRDSDQFKAPTVPVEWTSKRLKIAL